MSDAEPTYTISISGQHRWHAGYHIELDELFVYKIDSDQVITVFRKGGMDSLGFAEFMDFSKAELLGEL